MPGVDQNRSRNTDFELSAGSQCRGDARGPTGHIFGHLPAKMRYWDIFWVVSGPSPRCPKQLKIQGPARLQLRGPSKCPECGGVGWDGRHAGRRRQGRRHSVYPNTIIESHTEVTTKLATLKSPLTKNQTVLMTGRRVMSLSPIMSLPYIVGRRLGGSTCVSDIKYVPMLCTLHNERRGEVLSFTRPPLTPHLPFRRYRVNTFCSN